MIEVWRQIKNYPNYSVSNRGKIKNNKTCLILKPMKARGNYLQVGLYKNKIMKRIAIHKLVLEAFICKRPPNKQTNHKDGDKANNSVTNLEWVTAQENITHAHKNGLSNSKGSKNGNAKLKEFDVKFVKQLLKECNFEQRDIAAMVGVNKSAISKIATERTWKHIVI